jgi:opacity protein-like surface antigen
MPVGLRILGTTLLAAAVAAPASAADIIQPGDEKLTVMLGAFLPAFRTKVEVDGEQSTGDRIDLNRDLGADRNSSGGWFGAEWRFAPKHRLGFTYSRFTLRGDRVIDRDLHIGDKVFPIGAEVESQLRLELIPITYSYSLIKQDNDELAVTAGIHWDRLSFRVDGSASIGGRSAANEASSNANLPLPLFGLRYDHRFSERWSAGAMLAAFALKFGEETFDFQGSLISARLSAEYRFSRHFAAGAALDTFKVNAKASKGDWHGAMDYGYFGPQLYLLSRF